MNTKAHVEAGRVIATDAAPVRSLYAARRHIHPRAISGRFQQLRLAARVVLLGTLLLLPWLHWGGHPLVLLDLPARHFYILGSEYFADDVYIAAFVLIVGAFALFTFTNLAGRVWCGYACPQSVFFSLFIAVEEAIEGNAHQRRRNAEGHLSAEIALRRVATWGVWLIASFAFGFSSVALFVPAGELAASLFNTSIAGWALFWLAFFTLGCFLFAGFLREQVCFYMCPYARFQSAMFDRDTLVVGYDAGRGEPRAALKRGGEHAGDCVDCKLCVEVCPVGIDIREGLQYKCIQCGLCADACAPVMQRLDRPVGLIRYSTQNLIERGRHPFRLGRPRLFGYAAAMLLMCGVFVWQVASRIPYDLEVIRERHGLYRVLTLEQGNTATTRIENSFRVKVTNKTDKPRRIELAAVGPMPIEWVGEHSVIAAPGEIVELPVRLRVARTDMRHGIADVHFELRAIQPDGAPATIDRAQHFFGPTT